MNIIIINHYAGSPEMGMEFRPYYFAKEWQKKGHKVLIVAATYSHLRKKQGVKGFHKIDDINYYFVKTNEYQGNGIMRVMSMFSFIFKLLFTQFHILKDFKPDLVISSSTYPLDNYVSHKLSKHCAAKHIFEIHDLWPLSPMELGNMSKNHPFIVIMQKAENFAYKNCHKCVSILPNVHNHVKEHGLDLQKLTIIPNGINIKEWENPEIIPEKHKTLINSLKTKYDFLVGYTGGHAISNSLNTLLDLAKKCKNDSIAFVLVGNGQEKTKLIERQQLENIENLYFLDAIPKNAIPNLLSEFDALYIGWNKSSLYKYGVSPNKIFDYMMSAKPILQVIEYGDNIIENANCGFNVQPDDIEEIKNTLLKIKKLSSAERNILGNNGRNYVLQNHTYAKLADEFLQAIL